MLAWVAITVGAILALLGLIGALAGVPTPGVGARVEPRLDGLGHLLLAGCLLVNGGRDAADSESVAIGLVGSALGVAGIVVLILTRRRAPAAIARSSRTLYGRRDDTTP
ncbi:hypothetical protein GCM10009547_01110 [Sporichthya brevicatena]|uniref:Uncharacterized protein n=1 Tax=Sporichthya brevicatena TaxID=171442 RepID=A0ABP3R9V8_9ACTN